MPEKVVASLPIANGELFFKGFWVSAGFDMVDMTPTAQAYEVYKEFKDAVYEDIGGVVGGTLELKDFLQQLGTELGESAADVVDASNGHIVAGELTNLLNLKLDTWGVVATGPQMPTCHFDKDGNWIRHRLYRLKRAGEPWTAANAAAAFANWMNSEGHSLAPSTVEELGALQYSMFVTWRIGESESNSLT